MSGQNDTHKEGFFYTAGPALLSGAAQAILFNPFDRALYVRVKFRRERFLDRRNFEHPFQGFMNAAVYRTLVGASYMFWQDSARIFIENHMPNYLHASESPRMNAFLIGATAGTLNGAVLNGMQVVKYRMWNSDANTSFLRVALDAYKENGIRIFFRGIGATAFRDCIFGIVYESCRRSTAFKDFLDSFIISVFQRNTVMHNESLNNENNSKYNISHSNLNKSWNTEKCGACAFFSNLIAALLASIASAPFNYVRSVIYGAPSGSVPMRYFSLLHSFFFQARFIYLRGESFTDAKAVYHELDNTTPHGDSCNSKYQQYRLTSKAQQVRKKILSHSCFKNKHPVAALRWANTRLNIGWGSLRVGLGMAVGQSIFHMFQEVAQKI